MHSILFRLFYIIRVYKNTRRTHSVNASCSYEVHEDIICTVFFTLLANGNLIIQTHDPFHVILIP